MNRFVRFIAGLFFLFGFGTSAAQVMEVCSNGDTVTLHAGNYQYGQLQWQRSIDNSFWENIEGATDTVYRFFPEATYYYRVLVTYPACPGDSSQVTLVQVPPVADAGPKRVVNKGETAVLYGNQWEGAVGQWSILYGNGGTIDDATSPITFFTGEVSDSLYLLQWALTNACGTSRDTVQVIQLVTELYDAIVMVDSTDIILSDSLERSYGVYRIIFSDPVPTITDTTILVGITHGGFLRKVAYREYRGDTCLMYTSQATFDDILISGVIHFDSAIPFDTARGGHGYVRMNHLPTRKELLNNPEYQTGKLFYYKPYNDTMGRNGSKYEMSVALNEFIAISGNSEDLALNSDFRPLWMFDVYRYNKLTDLGLCFGLNPAFLSLSIGTLIEGTGISFQYSDELTISSDHLLIPTPGMPPLFIDVLCEFTVPFSVGLHFSSAGDAWSMMWEKSMTALLCYDSHDGFSKKFHSPPIKSRVNFGSLTGEVFFEFGIRAQFRLFTIIGPYGDVMLHSSYGRCYSSGEVPQVVDRYGVNMVFDFGIIGKILRKTFMDAHVRFMPDELVFSKNTYPSKLLYESGNRQQYTPGYPVPEPIRVKVIGNRLFGADDSEQSKVEVPAVNANVLFEPLNGGSVSQRIVATGADGIASTLWTPPSDAKGMLSASLFDCEGKHLAGSPLIFTAGPNCFQSTLEVLTHDNQDGSVTVEARGGVPPYRYYQGQIYGNFTTNPPTITPVLGEVSNVFVTDDFGCTAHARVFRPKGWISVTTGRVVDVVNNSAECVNNVILDEGTRVVERGVCWGIQHDPTIQNDHTSDGMGAGMFNSIISGLVENVTYYVRAYASNGQDVFYGDEEEFTTPVAPNITFSTDSVTNVTHNSAVVHGSVFQFGNDVRMGGLCLSTDPDPRIYRDDLIYIGQLSSHFSKTLYSLQPYTPYYVRVVIFDGEEIIYGNTISFLTQPQPTVDVSTGYMRNVTYSSADCISCSVNAFSGATIVQRGVCWSTSPYPTLQNNHTSDGTGTGYFDSHLSNLSQNTTYHIRAYASDGQTVYYGDTVQFRTPMDYGVTVTTLPVTDITYNSAVVHSTVTDPNAVVVASGVCWSIFSNPEVGLDNVMGYGSASGNLSMTLSGLQSSSRYFVRTYALVNNEYIYGNTVEFTTEECFPEAEIDTVHSVTQTSAVVESQFGNDCDVFVYETGICWATHASPKCDGNDSLYRVAQSASFSLSGFTHQLENLMPNQTYYVRPYVLYQIDTIYGDEESFTTPGNYALPSVNTLQANNVSTHSASCGVYLISNGGDDSTRCGIRWGTSVNNLNDTSANMVTLSDSSSAYISISGLSPETIYYFAAFAVNAAGESMGPVLAFRTESQMGVPCDNATISDIDSNVYHTVLIGTQCWMKENLRTTRYADGTTIPLGTSASTTDAYRYYPTSNVNTNVNIRNVGLYGYLYNWPAVMHGASSSSSVPSGVQGVCPTGWHVPSYNEWMQFLGFLSANGYFCGGDSTHTAKPLASISGWDSSTSSCAPGNNQSTNNATGFTAIAGGFNINSSMNGDLGEDAYFWTSTARGSIFGLGNFVYHCRIHYSDSAPTISDGMKMYELPVRCVKN